MSNRSIIPETSTWCSLAAIATLLATTTACLTAADEGAADGDQPQSLNGSTTYVGCTAAETTKLTSAMQTIVGTMASTGYRECLKNAYTVESHGYLVEDMISRLQAMPTTIRCPVVDCGGGALACTGVGSSTGGPNPESMSVLKSTIANYTVLDLAGIIAHEATHQQGWNHLGSTAAFTYPFSVPEQVRACLVNGDANGFTRADPRFDSELPKMGGEGGEIYGVWCPGGTRAVGITAQSTSTAVRGFRFQCSDGSVTGYNGGTGGTTVTRTCPAGQSLAGFLGRSGSFVSSLSAGCESDADLASGVASPFSSWTWLGGATSGGTVVERACPAGKAVVGALGRAGGYLDSVRWICRDLDAPALPNPHVVGRVGVTDAATMMASDQICGGAGALIGLMGQASVAVDQLNGLCLPRAPGLGPSGEVLLDTSTSTVRHALEYSGGFGGTVFELPCATREAVVGLRVRGDARVEAIGAVCASTATWSLGSTATTNLPLQGGPGGTYTILSCPPTEFVVGLESWWSATPELAGSPVTVHAVSPICRRLE